MNINQDWQCRYLTATVFLNHAAEFIDLQVAVDYTGQVGMAGA